MDGKNTTSRSARKRMEGRSCLIAFGKVRMRRRSRLLVCQLGVDLIGGGVFMSLAGKASLDSGY